MGRVWVVWVLLLALVGCGPVARTLAPIQSTPSARLGDAAKSAPPSPVPPAPTRSQKLPDLRPARIGRPANTMKAEIGGLTALVEATHRSSPDRALLLSRLASGWIELERAQAPHEQNTARAEAIQRLRQVLSEHPEFPRADQVLYALAVELDRDGQEALMLSTLDELYRRFPASDETRAARAALQPAEVPAPVPAAAPPPPSIAPPPQQRRSSRSSSLRTLGGSYGPERRISSQSILRSSLLGSDTRSWPGLRSAPSSPRPKRTATKPASTTAAGSSSARPWPRTSPWW